MVFPPGRLVRQPELHRSPGDGPPGKRSGNPETRPVFPPGRGAALRLCLLGCSIYGSSAPLPLTEEFMSLHLSSPYQITKMLGELYCNFFQHHYDLPAVKARFFNSYGPGEVPGQYRNVIPNFIYLAMQGQPLPITGTGEETRDFTFVGDIVDGLLRAGHFEAAVGQEFNLASGAETRIIDLAEMINRKVGNQAGSHVFRPA